MDNFKQLFTVILVVLGLVVTSLVYSLDRLENKKEQETKVAVDKFVALVNSKGYIDNLDYTQLLYDLDATGGIYEVEMEYSNKRYQPNYDDPANPATFKGTYEEIYDAYYSKDILNVLYPQNGTPESDVSRRWNMKQGDLFFITVRGISESPGSKLKQLVTSVPSETIYYKAGGMIQNEAP